jgi:hypothetical protein
VYEYCFGIIQDDEKTFVLVRGSFVSTRLYIMIKTDFPEDFRFPQVAKDREEQGFDPRKNRRVCAAVKLQKP